MIFEQHCYLHCKITQYFEEDKFDLYKKLVKLQWIIAVCLMTARNRSANSPMKLGVAVEIENKNLYV